ncbi:MAG: alkaline phosphatase family protein [Acidobacteriia bacterium]|nr:alkaline phosphatase family protein [Terriglobia bacterium]
MRRSTFPRARAVPLLALLVLAACGGPGGGTGVPEARTSLSVPVRKVLVVGLDGADWEIVDRLASAGRLPNLSRLRREGASGILDSEQPLLSPVVWTTLATGRPPTDHGIVGFLTVRNGVAEPVRSDERRVRAFWNVASDRGVRVGVIGWYASWPAEKVNGYLVSDRVGSHQVAGGAGPVSTGLAYPESLVPEIERLRAEVDRDVGDEAAAAYFSGGGKNDIPAAAQGEKLATFFGVLRTTELYRRLVPILMERYDPAIAAVYFEGTDAVGHLFEPYAPPPPAGVILDDARRLAGAFDRYYESIDRIVGELAARIDPRTTTLLILSDHGFKTGDRRPRTPEATAFANQAPAWHRPQGILLLWGRGVRAGSSLPPSSIYDVLPTIFRLVGIPLARTLKGKPVEAALAPDLLTEPARTIADYESAGERERPAPAEIAPDDQMAKLRALGYIGGSPGEHLRPAADGQAAVPLNRYNEGVVLLDSGRRREALDVFLALERDAAGFSLGYLGEGLVRIQEGNPGAAIPALESAVKLDSTVHDAHAALGEAYLSAGRRDDGIRSLRRALAIDPANGRTSLLLAEALLERRDVDEAGRLFAVARKLSDKPEDRAGGCVGLAILAEERKRFDEATSLYQEALALAPGFPSALERFANLDLFLGRPEPAVELLAKLVDRAGGSPRALALYGKALIFAGRSGEARPVLEKALALDPHQREARELLDGLGR